MDFNNRLKEISGKIEKIYTNKKTSHQVIANLNKQFEDLRGFSHKDESLLGFVKVVEQFMLILIQHSNQLDGNEKYIPIFRTSLHTILSVIDSHQFYGRFIQKSSAMLNKFFECSPNMLCLKEFFKFYNLCLTRADKNCIRNFAMKHKLTCFKVFEWVKLVRDPEFQFVLTETVSRLIEDNSESFVFFTNEADLKRSFESIDLKQPYKRIREFVSLINTKREDLYSVCCKRITIDGNVMEYARVNNEILPLYLYFDMYDSKLSFYCNENLVSEISEEPFNNLEFVTFLSHEIKDVNTYYEANGSNFCVHIQLKNSILNLTPNNRLDKYRNFIFCASDQSDNFTEFVKIVFSPLFPPASQLVLEGSFDSTIFNNVSRCDTSRSSIQSALLLSENLEGDNLKTQLINGHDTFLLERALLASPTAEMSMLSTTFETLNDINSDDDDEETVTKDKAKTGQPELINRRNDEELEAPVNEQSVKQSNLMEMDQNQPGTTEKPLLVEEENSTSKVTRWLETTDIIEIIDDKIPEAKPTNEISEENCIVISDDETEAGPVRLESITNNEIVEKNNPNCTERMDNCVNVIDISNNQINVKTNNESICLIDQSSLNIESSNNRKCDKTNSLIGAKDTNDIFATDSRHRIESNDNNVLNVSKVQIENEVDQIVNTQTATDKDGSIMKNVSIKDDDKQPLNTNELLSILEDTEKESPQTSIIILSSNKTAPKKRKALFKANETKFYEFSFEDIREQQKQQTKKEPNKSTVRHKKFKEEPNKLSSKPKNKKQTNKAIEINDKKVANGAKEKTTRKKRSPRKSERIKKQTGFCGFNDVDMKISTNQKNDRKSTSGSFSKFDLETCNAVNIVAQKYGAFGELKDYVLKKQQSKLASKSTENIERIDKTVNLSVNETKQSLESIDNMSNKVKEVNSDDEIVSPFKNTGYGRKTKRVFSESSSSDENIAVGNRSHNRFNNENIEEDNSPKSPKKTKYTNESHKINIISNITINGPTEPSCRCLEDLYNIVVKEVSFRQYHHPQLSRIPGLIKRALKM